MKRNIPLIFFLILLLLVSVSFFGLIEDYLLACFWAILLALLFHPMFNRFKNRFNQNENLAAALTLIVIILLVVIPVLLIGTLVAMESIEFFRSLESGEIDLIHRLEKWQEQLPLAQEWLESYGVHFEETKDSFWRSAVQLGRNLAYGAMGITQNMFGFFVQFFVMLYILFFFFKRRHTASQNPSKNTAFRR